MSYSLKNNFGTIKITGHDAARFLQGQLTNDIYQCTASHYQLNAICNAEGRVLAIGHVLKVTDDHYVMISSRDLITTIIQYLQRFRLRAKVEFEDISETATDLIMAAQAQMHKLVPLLTQATSLKFTAHSLNLVELHGISFTKGCYTGQEIIARTHYRGQSKTQLYNLEINYTENKIDDLQPGQTLFIEHHHAEQELGVLLNIIRIENHQLEILAVLSSPLIQQLTVPFVCNLQTNGEKKHLQVMTYKKIMLSS